MGRLEELEDRLIALEDSVYCKVDSRAFDSLGKRVYALEAKEYNLDREALRQPVTAKDIDRWRKIEKAAKKAVAPWEGLLTKEGLLDRLLLLKEALK